MLRRRGSYRKKCGKYKVYTIPGISGMYINPRSDNPQLFSGNKQLEIYRFSTSSILKAKNFTIAIEGDKQGQPVGGTVYGALVYVPNGSWNSDNKPKLNNPIFWNTTQSGYENDVLLYDNPSNIILPFMFTPNTFTCKFSNKMARNFYDGDAIFLLLNYCNFDQSMSNDIISVNFQISFALKYN